MASKRTSTMVLVMAFNIILLFSHFTETAHGQVTAGACPASALGIRLCASELTNLVRTTTSINNGGVGVGVGLPPHPPNLLICCNLIRGLTDTQATDCIRVSVAASILGAAFPEADYSGIIRNLCAFLP